MGGEWAGLLMGLMVAGEEESKDGSVGCGLSSWVDGWCWLGKMGRQKGTESSYFRLGAAGLEMPIQLKVEMTGR